MTESQPFTISTWKWLLGLSVFFLALLISVPSFARIMATLENPGQGDTASGITAISGWAYSTTGTVTVKLRLNGETAEEIPCCGPRSDVEAALSDAPPNSGFGLLYNYGNLPAGVHTVGVEVSAAGEETMVIDHAVTVVVPADSEFLSAVDLSGASVIKEGNKIVVSGLEVTDKASGDTMTISVDLNYKTGSQSFQVTEAQGSADLHIEEILRDVAHAIFATYDALHMAATDPEVMGRQTSLSTLREAVYSLVGTSMVSEADAIAILPAVQHAWRDARVPWEQSEAFLFGPVADDEHDPFLDTWPLNVTDLEAIIASDAVIYDPRDPTAVVELADDVQGFHALEYLLFQDKDGNTDPASIVAALSGSERRQDYARRVADEFITHTQALRDKWDPEMGNFVAELAEAGHGSMTYTSERAAMQTLLEAMIGIAAELHDAKLGASSPAEEESRFSNNSRIDFLNNVRSINNVYEGRFDQSDSTSMGVTDFVAHENPALDAEVRMAIRDTKAAIIAIPEPFGMSITAHPDAVANAIQAAMALEAKLEEVKAVVDTADFGHDH